MHRNFGLTPFSLNLAYSCGNIVDFEGKMAQTGGFRTGRTRWRIRKRELLHNIRSAEPAVCLPGVALLTIVLTDNLLPEHVCIEALRPLILGANHCHMVYFVQFHIISSFNNIFPHNDSHIKESPPQSATAELPGHHTETSSALSCDATPPCRATLRRFRPQPSASATLPPVCAICRFVPYICLCHTR